MKEDNGLTHENDIQMASQDIAQSQLGGAQADLAELTIADAVDENYRSVAEVIVDNQTGEATVQQAQPLTANKKALSNWLDPVIPKAKELSGEDSDGWCFIDKIGGWNSYLCQFQVIEEVPAQHRETWTWAFSTILERIDSASSSTELDRGLMWLMF